MKAADRRKEMLHLLMSEQNPVSGGALAKRFGVSRQIIVQDISLLKAIEKALQTSNIGITPTNDGKVIRLAFPQLTEERRKELSKQVKKMGEDSKIAQRNIRRDALEQLKKLKNDKVLSEDEYASCEKDVEKYVSEAIAEIDALAAAKEKEIMTV